jgi:ubiquinone/menaquinone biosynthesis C-methylase UbiE
MHKSLAKQLIKTNEKSYDFIAEDFAHTRAHPWQEMKDFMPFIKEGAAVLDIGCGSGRTFDLLEEKKVQFTGTDISEGMLEHCKKKYEDNVLNPVFEKADAADLPYDDNAFDVVTGIAVLHHLPSYELRKKALEEMKRVVKPGGYILLTNWNLWQLKYAKRVLQFGFKQLFTEDRYDFGDVMIPWVTKTAVVKRYYHAFTLSSLKRLAENADLELIEHKLYPPQKKHSFIHYFNSRNIWTVLKKR